MKNNWNNLKENSKNSTKVYKIETGTGKILISHIVPAVLKISLDTLDLIVWMLSQWLCIQFGLLTLLKK